MSKPVKTKQISMFKPVRTKPTQFFQVVLPATLEAKKLKIPDAFVEHLNGFLVAVVMRNKMGKLWHVSLRYIHNEVFFQHGWENFVKDNCVKRGRGGGGGGGGYSNSRRKEEEEEVEVEEVEVEVEDTATAEEEEAATTNLMTIDKKKCGNNGSKKCASVRARTPRELDNIFTREILVPRYVLRDFGIQLAEHVTFHDELERTWPGTVICGKDGRTRITGWGPVCRWNQVKKNDLCICEFPEAGGAKNIILVHIHRHAGSQSQATNQEPNQADQ
ncbi:hypothetical protein Pint_34135 [Pistacia integerrima]|uniref:Uncharacterized protein n=1 Tax=Pistacia integerrima TaxID=434235 RepID=A0ACC0X4V9_9ROSI|nr:hypothetical protein Pint_34135 [Pistacia integerrima]